MKLWKATAAMLMALGFAFSAAACGDDGAISGISGLNSSSAKPESSSVSVSVGETSDKQSETSSEATSEETSSEATSSEASSESTSSEATSSETSSEATSSETSSESSEVVVNPLAEKFMGIIEKSVSEAKSFNLTYTFTSDYVDDIANPSDYDEFISAKVNVTVSIKDTATDIYAEVFEVKKDNTEVKQAQVYMVDNYMYASARMYVGEENGVDKYEMSPYFKVKEDLATTLEEVQSLIQKQLTIPDEMVAMVEEMLLSIEGQDFLPAWEEVKGATLNSFTIDGNTMVLGFDAPAYIEAALDAILDYDYTQTVETVVNAALLEASGDAELTMTTVLDEMATWGAITVEDLYADLDAWLTETYETDVQTIYNTVVFDETFEEIIAMVSGDPNVAAQFQSITDLETFLFGVEGQMKDVTIDNLLVMMESMFGGSGGTAENGPSPSPMSDSSEEETVSVAALVEMLRSMKDMKLEDIPAVQQVVSTAQTIKDKLTVNELGMELGAEFEGAGDAIALKNLYYKVAFDLDAEITSYDEHDSASVYTSKSAFSMEYTLNNFSKTAVAITLPEDMQTVEVWLCENGCGEFVMEMDYNYYDNKIVCDDCYEMLNAADMGSFEGGYSERSIYATIDFHSTYWAKFTVVTAGEYRAKIYTNKDVYPYIIDENGQWLTSSIGFGSLAITSEVVYLEPGTYYLSVKNGSSEQVSTSVYVEKVARCAMDNCGLVADKTLYGVKYCEKHYAVKEATQINNSEHTTWGYSVYKLPVSSYYAGEYSVCIYSDEVNDWPEFYVEVYADENLTEYVGVNENQKFENGFWVDLMHMDLEEGEYYVLLYTRETLTYTITYSRGYVQVECTNCWSLDVNVKQMGQYEYLCADCEANWLERECYYAEELLLNERVNLPDYGDKAIIDLKFTQDGQWYRVYKVVVPEDDYSGHYYVCAEDAVVSIVLYDENGNKVNMTDNGYDYRTEITSIQGYLSAGTYYVKVGTNMNNTSDFTITYLYFARNNER